MHRLELGARRFQFCARRKPAEELRHPMLAAGHHRRRQMMRAGDDVGDELGLGRIRHGRLEDADNGRRAGAEANGLAEHLRIAVERGGPEAVRQHRRARRVLPIVARAEQAADHRAQPHHLEVRPADDAGANDARLAEADHGEVDGGEVAERGDRLYARA